MRRERRAGFEYVLLRDSPERALNELLRGAMERLLIGDVTSVTRFVDNFGIGFEVVENGVTMIYRIHNGNLLQEERCQI